MAENPDSAEMLMVIQQIQALHCKETREAALQSLVQWELSPSSLLIAFSSPSGVVQILIDVDDSIRENSLPLLLWHSFGAVSILIQEIMSVNRSVSSPYLSNRVRWALALFQGIASLPRAKLILIYAQIPKHLKPFLDIRNEEMHHESLRRSSLVVLEALVKTATFIVHRILLNKDVFSHCDQAGRFLDILRRLELMINELAKDGSLAEDTRKQLLKQITLCYHRLSENPSAYAKLRNRLPKELRDSSFTNILQDDAKTMRCLQKLLWDVDFPALPQKVRQPVQQRLSSTKKILFTIQLHEWYR